ncbi:ABC transporter permease [Puniceibacterium sp. IMCC21224]|uniref:ABC transporter permease n=1 Tax=Puniceibacterium sp. IMCC21224 TaxID=1618204 RepID=UPI00064DAB83|nr:MlaE family lipid ABC transporter permease subunit [Puniceibacterium sp. IMCC21224]KMK65635.1 ABC transport permease subunit [Puniceibacterium sp. IMCC21224]
MLVKSPPLIDVLPGADGPHVTLRGAITIAHVTNLVQTLDTISADQAATVDLSEVSHLDTSGAWALTRLRQRLEAAGQNLTIKGASPGVESLLVTISDTMPEAETRTAPRRSLTDLVEGVGRRVMEGANFVLDLTGYLGLFLARIARAIRHPREFRLTALVHHCDEVGVRAVPIVALMSFLIGVVLAFQGSTQLRQFGAEVFVVDLIAVSILRELGILLTSIIVAGRTASAFTAAIGSMKMREEIDAMRTLGLDPAMVLFVPRILALLLMLPILGLVANLMGLIGGGLMAWIDLGISPAMFVTRLVEGTDIGHVVVGMVKAPFFAVIIGVVGCHAGMQVGSNAESLGRMTSNAVVTAIFTVIVADAVFSIFFAQLGV